MSEQSFDWIDELLKSRPSVPPHRTTNLEILGLDQKELIYSRLLAYFLDLEEDHKLGMLWLRSLILATKFPESRKEEKRNWLRRIEVSSLDIEREVNNIDLLIRETDLEKESQEDEKDQPKPSKGNWAILIENKIWSKLHNDLAGYWDSVEERPKLGIVLAPYNLQEQIEDKIKDRSDVDFYPLTYQELGNKVLELLPEYLLHADDRGLTRCREFLTVIQQLYPNPEIQVAMKKTLKAFQSNAQKIKELFILERNLSRYVDNQINHEVGKLGFGPTSNGPAKWRHYYFQVEDKPLGNFRFYVNHEQILFDQKLIIIFELYGDIKSEELKALYNDLEANLKKQSELPPLLKDRSPLKSTNRYLQFLCKDIHIGDKDFEEVLKQAFEEFREAKELIDELLSPNSAS